MNGRRWLLLVVMLAALISLAACDSKSGDKPGDGKTAASQGPSGNVIVGTFGGDTVKVLNETVNPVLAGSAPNVKVVYAVGMNTERMTKLRVEKEGSSSFDVIHVNDRDMQILINEGLLLKLDAAKLPNAKNLFPGFKSEYYIPYNFSANTIVYNKNQVTPAPTSWAVMWDPKYKGKIGVLNNLWTDHTYIAALLEGTAYKNEWDAGWDRLLKLADQDLKVFSAMETLGIALQTGEIWLTVTRRARAVQWAGAGGEPLGNILPQEGVYPVTFCAAIPKNARNADGAHAYLNALLDQKPQIGFAEVMGYAPAVSGIPLSEKTLSSIGFSEEEMKRIKPIDLIYVGKNDARWKEQWDKKILSR
jgi:putative spermidine/putrescine transport system substrate-binding protein